MIPAGIWGVDKKQPFTEFNSHDHEDEKVVFSEQFELTGVVEIFPQKGGWFFVRVPQKFSKLTQEFADRGLVAVTATVGRTSWPTSLMPMGDGTQFIPLPKKVRRAEGIELDQKITLSFQLRER